MAEILSGWSTERVLALAPDASSVSSGRGLASPAKWQVLGASSTVVWGDCKGSGAKPYQVLLDRASFSAGHPSWRCTCPSRKQPCKHVLGLALLCVSNGAAFSVTQTPDYAQEWLAKREAASLKKEIRKAEKPAAPKSQDSPGRIAQMTVGLNDLNTWLKDAVRLGFNEPRLHRRQTWLELSKKMVDAKTPGAAFVLREISAMPFAGENWCAAVLEKIGWLYLLCKGFENLDRLSGEERADLLSAAGVQMAPGEDSLRIQDQWIVYGVATGHLEENLRYQRTWCFGVSSGQWGLLLEFAHSTGRFEKVFSPGIVLEGEAEFYPSAFPMRMQLKSETLLAMKVVPIDLNLKSTLDNYSYALGKNPWLLQYPLVLSDARIVQEGTKSFLDSDGHLLPMPLDQEGCLTWLSVSEGEPVKVMGEWTGAQLRPLSIWHNQQWYGLGIEKRP